jgi:hypothetical protein
MTAKLDDGGVLALLCSNRFLSTKGGYSLRSLLQRQYRVAELWDLGDSKLFEAAVLPAIVIARRGADHKGEKGSYVRVYEANSGSGEPRGVTSSLLDALEEGVAGSIQAGNRSFVIERGELIKPASERPWRLTSSRSSRWLAAVRKRSAERLGDIGRIRVGIKTTADKVFIRGSWKELPEQIRPEESLLRPLLTHRVAARWRAQDNATGARTVLYTHESVEGKRRPVVLENYPRAAAYLELHRDQLESRDYVRKAGRAWYEIWVPQQPDGWAAPKLVWPDISEGPRFFLDHSGAVVNGDCYWLSCGNLSKEQLRLAMAVANSSFAIQHYDLCCGNRLYSGRRRFITQYLEELPLPIASSAALSVVSETVEQLQRRDLDPDARLEVESTLDAIIFELFGLKEPARQS